MLTGALAFQCGERSATNTYKELKALGRMNHRVRLFILVRAWSLDVDGRILRIKLMLACPLAIASNTPP